MFIHLFSATSFRECKSLRRHGHFTLELTFCGFSFFKLRNSFSKPHAILNFVFFVVAKKKTFVFLTAICGLKKTALFAKLCTLITIFLNFLLWAWRFS